MNSIEKTTRLSISREILIQEIHDRIDGYRKHPLDSLYNHSTYFQWDNVRLVGNNLTIEKSVKPFGGGSLGSSTGTIESEIIDDGGQAVLKTRITLDTSLGIFAKYVFIVGVSLSGIAWLIVDFNFVVLAVLLLILALLFRMGSVVERTGLNDLERYYNEIIRELVAG